MPVARFCVRHGALLPEITDALKAALLRAAREQLAAAGEQVTASRLSVMSGVHRKDSSKFLKGMAPQRDVVSPAIEVLGCWHTKRKYRHANGRPRALTVGNEQSEFALLVREISADVHPHTVLCELERLKLVEVHGDTVLPLKATFVTAMDDEQTAQIIARDIDELMCAAEENVNSSGARPHHHTTTIFDNIPQEYEPELREWINQEARALHSKIRDRVSQYDRDLSERALNDSSAGTIRFVFGSFGRVSVVRRQTNESDNSNAS